VSAADEATVRRDYEQMGNERKNELIEELFAADHRMHDPQVPTETWEVWDTLGFLQQLGVVPAAS
jgi:hypothetical protein